MTSRWRFGRGRRTQQPVRDAVPIGFGESRPFDMVAAGERAVVRRKWITSHSSLLGSLTLAVAAIVQAFSAAQYRPNLASAIISYSTPSVIVLGTFAAALPALVGFVGVFAVLMLRDTPEPASRRRLIWVTLFAILYSVMLSPILYTIMQIMAVAITLVEYVGQRYWHANPVLLRPGVQGAPDDVWLNSRHRPDVTLQGVLKELREISAQPSAEDQRADRRAVLHEEYRVRFEAIDAAYDLDQQSIYLRLARRTLILAFPALLATGQFWVPAEIITIPKEQPLTVYVLNTATAVAACRERLRLVRR